MMKVEKITLKRQGPDTFLLLGNKKWLIEFASKEEIFIPYPDFVNGILDGIIFLYSNGGKFVRRETVLKWKRMGAIPASKWIDRADLRELLAGEY
jgi:hypothetical protein